MICLEDICFEFFVLFFPDAEGDDPDDSSKLEKYFVGGGSRPHVDDRSLAGQRRLVVLSAGPLRMGLRRWLRRLWRLG
jgi:hypothetical protein